MKAGYGKAGKQKTLSNFPTATTTTNYNYLWDTDSEGKVRLIWEGALVDIYGVLGEGRRELSKDEMVFRLDGSVDGTMAYILTLPREGVPREVSTLLEQFDAVVDNTRRQRAARNWKFIANWKAERLALARTAKKPRRLAPKTPSHKPIEIPRGNLANAFPIYAPAPEMEFV